MEKQNTQERNNRAECCTISNRTTNELIGAEVNFDTREVDFFYLDIVKVNFKANYDAFDSPLAAF